MTTYRLKIRNSMSGPGGEHMPGDIYTTTDRDEARRFVLRRCATLVGADDAAAAKAQEELLRGLSPAQIKAISDGTVTVTRKIGQHGELHQKTGELNWAGLTEPLATVDPELVKRVDQSVTSRYPY
jgi:hypothetical protein